MVRGIARQYGFIGIASINTPGAVADGRQCVLCAVAPVTSRLLGAPYFAIVLPISVYITGWLL